MQATVIDSFKYVNTMFSALLLHNQATPVNLNNFNINNLIAKKCTEIICKVIVIWHIKNKNSFQITIPLLSTYKAVREGNQIKKHTKLCAIIIFQFK